jgi:cell division protein FtsA
MMSKNNFVVGLDLGTTKTCCLVGELVKTEIGSSLQVVGMGVVPSVGLRRGAIVDSDSTTKAMLEAVEEAELMAGVKVSTVFTGIAGGLVRPRISEGLGVLKGGPGAEGDVRGVVSSAEAIIQCAGKAGLDVAEFCLESIASGEAVLSQSEKELGVVLVDVGGGTTDIAIFKSGVLVHAGVLPMGGHQITNDVALGLRITQGDAEKLKIRRGCALRSLVKPEETIEVPGVGGKNTRILSRLMLAEMIEPRVEEIFTLIQGEIIKSGFQGLLSAGVVVTGGATLLEGVLELAEWIFEVPARRGLPQGIGGLREVVNSPRYATVVGLLKYGAKSTSKTRSPVRERNIYDQVRGSMRTWIKDLF